MGAIIGAAASQINFWLMVIGVWVITSIDFVRVGFFPKGWRRITGNMVSCAIIGLFLAYLARHLPRPAATPTLDQVVDKLGQAFPNLRRPALVQTIAAPATNPPRIQSISRPPVFHLDLAREYLTPVGADKLSTQVVVTFSASNSGDPATISTVGLALELGGNIYRALYPVHPGRAETFRMGEEGALRGDAHWTYVLGEKAPKLNTTVAAWTSGVFQGIAVQQILDSKAVLTITCTDATGREWSAFHQFTGNDYPIFSTQQ